MTQPPFTAETHRAPALPRRLLMVAILLLLPAGLFGAYAVTADAAADKAQRQFDAVRQDARNTEAGRRDLILKTRQHTVAAALSDLDEIDRTVLLYGGETIDYRLVAGAGGLRSRWAAILPEGTPDTAVGDLGGWIREVKPDGRIILQGTRRLTVAVPQENAP